MPATETKPRQIGLRSTERRHFKFWEGISTLETKAAETALEQLMRRAVYVQTDPERQGTAVSIGDQVVVFRADQRAGLSSETQALRDWLESDSLDWDAVERARSEAWGN